MKIRALPVVAGSLLLSAPLAATADSVPDRLELGANVTLTSEYLFRGIPQSSGDPAIQGSFDATFDTGTFADIYAGIWASSIEFRPQSAPGTNDPGSVEIDYFGGLTGTIPETKVSWDLGFTYFSYPDQSEEDTAGGGENEFNYVEANAGLGYDLESIGPVDPSASVGYAFSPDFFGNGGNDSSHYVSGSMDFGLPYGFGAGALVGYQTVSNVGGFDYAHYSLSLSKQIRQFTLSVAWNDGFADGGDAPGTEDQFTASISAGF